jgi:hypothetical protein
MNSARPRAPRGAALLLLGGLLSGCGATSAAPSAQPGTAPPPASTPTSAAPAPGTAVAPPWPEGGDDAVDALQERVDGGSQPWLLDPSEVALSYATAAYGWTDAEAVPRDGGGAVVVTGPGGATATLTLAQPGRTGPTGIWVVTAAERS